MIDIISFIHWNVNPEIFQLGPFSVRWYGLLFASGFLLGYYIGESMLKSENVNQKWIDSLFFYIIIATIVGARLGHVFFYGWDYYSQNPAEIFMVWHGGLASHGGTLGILIALIVHSKLITKRSVLWTLDRVVVPTALVAAFIRMGNLMNSEIYGDVTTLPWGFIFVRDGLTVAHHPTQIYEALSYLFLFVFLYRYYWKHDGRPVEGRIFAYFLIVLWTVRFLIEFIKLPQVDFESHMMLNMGQWLSIPLIIGGLVILYISGKKAIKPATK